MVWENAGLMERLQTGFGHVELTWRHFLSVPGPVAAQRHTGAAFNSVDTLQHAYHSHDQTPRVRPHDVLPFTTWIWAQTSKDVGVTNFNFI